MVRIGHVFLVCLEAMTTMTMMIMMVPLGSDVATTLDSHSRGRPRNEEMWLWMSNRVRRVNDAWLISFDITIARVASFQMMIMVWAQQRRGKLGIRGSCIESTEWTESELLVGRLKPCHKTHVSSRISIRFDFWLGFLRWSTLYEFVATVMTVVCSVGPQNTIQFSPFSENAFTDWDISFRRPTYGYTRCFVTIMALDKLIMLLWPVDRAPPSPLITIASYQLYEIGTTSNAERTAPVFVNQAYRLYVHFEGILFDCCVYCRSVNVCSLWQMTALPGKYDLIQIVQISNTDIELFYLRLDGWLTILRRWHFKRHFPFCQLISG